MRQTSSRALAIAAVAMLATSGAGLAEDALAPVDPKLRAAVGGPSRSPKFLERDAVRHPLEELTFLGLQPTSTVVEVWPTGGYWTEILAPYLHDHGTYYAALESQAPGNPGHDAALKRAAYFKRRLAEDPAALGAVRVTALGPDQDAIAPAGSVDLILSFRDLHLWMKQGFAEQALVDFYKALKPGGILALEDHRGNRNIEQDIKAADGYVREDYAKGLAQLAGFAFVGSSEIEANPKDTAAWPRGVWTLGPTFALGAQDRDTYAAIGEPDNFVLKFRKPQ
jgi:predicted methyltransferase